MSLMVFKYKIQMKIQFLLQLNGIVWFAISESQLTSEELFFLLSSSPEELNYSNCIQSSFVGLRSSAPDVMSGVSIVLIT